MTILDIRPTRAEVALAALDAAELAWSDLRTALDTDSPALKLRYLDRALTAEADALFLKGAIAL